MDIEITPSDVMDIPSSPEEERLMAQAEALKLPVWNETPDGISAAEFVQAVPLQFLRRHRIVPLVVKGKTYIAANDLTLFESVDDLKRLLKGSEASLVLAPESAILSAIDSLYNLSSDPVKAFVQTFSDESYDRILSEIEDTGDLLDDAHEAPMIQLVNLILSRAIRDRASDIHIEPYQNSLKIRYRVDGMLSSAMDLPRRIHAALVSRIKIMARLNIAEKRLPQDGRIDARVGDRSVDVRVSVLPTAFGERLVLRVLDKTRSVLRFTDLGFNYQTIGAFNRLTQTPYGIILVTGPTGSGKTTTLYAMLSHLNNPGINIITIEDPIEFYHKHKNSVVTQREVHNDVPSFADAIRRALRQDPDCILVGEMRDLETIGAAITAAETGHLVFGTLHTTGAAETVDRIVDSFPTNQQAQVRTQLAGSLICVISQVLLKRIDKKGRIAAFEIMIGTPSIAALIRDGKTFRITSDIQTGAKYGMNTLDAHLLQLYSEGKISYGDLITKAKDAEGIIQRLQLEAAQKK